MPFCAYCGREISARAAVCPNCGHPNEQRTAIPEVAFTPPGSSLELAGFWRRFAGLFIDGLIVSLVTAPFAFRGFNPASEIASFVYAWLMIGLNRGQTVGAMAMGVRITRPNGEAVDLGRAAARAAMAIVSGLAILLGYLWAIWDSEKRTWHDMVADTRVYRTR
jgi:uncharacterized RDD family membrane protein YckC